MTISRRLAAVAAFALLAACSNGAGGGAETNESAANAAAEAPAPKAGPAEQPRAEENTSGEERQDRPLPDFAAFRMSEAEQEARLSRTYNSCMEAAGSTADYRGCSGAEFERIERQMERALEQAQEGLSEGARERLRSDQRRWRTGLGDLCQRELEEEGAEGGSMDLLTLDSCSLREAVRRTLWLDSLR